MGPNHGSTPMDIPERGSLTTCDPGTLAVLAAVDVLLQLCYHLEN